MGILSLNRLHVTANVHVGSIWRRFKSEYTALWQKIRDWRDVLCRKKRRRKDHKAGNVGYRS